MAEYLRRLLTVSPKDFDAALAPVLDNPGPMLELLAVWLMGRLGAAETGVRIDAIAPDLRGLLRQVPPANIETILRGLLSAAPAEIARRVQELLHA